MELPDLKSLDKILALCRKRGVQVIEIGELRITLGDTPVRHTSVKKSEQSKYSIQGEVVDSPNTPTEEELLFWSSGESSASDSDSAPN